MGAFGAGAEFARGVAFERNGGWLGVGCLGFVLVLLGILAVAAWNVLVTVWNGFVVASGVAAPVLARVALALAIVALPLLVLAMVARARTTRLRFVAIARFVLLSLMTVVALHGAVWLVEPAALATEPDAEPAATSYDLLAIAALLALGSAPGCVIVLWNRHGTWWGVGGLAAVAASIMAVIGDGWGLGFTVLSVSTLALAVIAEAVDDLVGARASRMRAAQFA